MKKVNVTFSIPIETQQLLQSLVGRRKMSSFVAMALDKALIEKIEVLKNAYIEAEKDPSRKEIINDWSSIDFEGWE
jgi:hypothetical protein